MEGLDAVVGRGTSISCSGSGLDFDVVSCSFGLQRFATFFAAASDTVSVFVFRAVFLVASFDFVFLTAEDDEEVLEVGFVFLTVEALGEEEEGDALLAADALLEEEEIFFGFFAAASFFLTVRSLETRLMARCIDAELSTFPTFIEEPDGFFIAVASTIILKKCDAVGALFLVLQ